MRTSQGKRLSFDTRYIVSISHEEYTVASKVDIEWLIEQKMAVLVTRYYAPEICVAVYDFLPRDITASQAITLARHCLAICIGAGIWN